MKDVLEFVELWWEFPDSVSGTTRPGWREFDRYTSRFDDIVKQIINSAARCVRLRTTATGQLNIVEVDRKNGLSSEMLWRGSSTWLVQPSMLLVSQLSDLACGRAKGLLAEVPDGHPYLKPAVVKALCRWLGGREEGPALAVVADGQVVIVVGQRGSFGFSEKGPRPMQ